MPYYPMPIYPIYPIAKKKELLFSRLENKWPVGLDMKLSQPNMELADYIIKWPVGLDMKLSQPSMGLYCPQTF